MTSRCDSCAEVTAFRSPQGDCLACAQHDPLERAAIALFNVAMHNLGWPSKQWDDPQIDTVDGGRENFRNRARTALTAAINVEELAEHIGLDNARTVAVHLLGSETLDE